MAMRGLLFSALISVVLSQQVLESEVSQPTPDSMVPMVSTTTMPQTVPLDTSTIETPATPVQSDTFADPSTAMTTLPVDSSATAGFLGTFYPVNVLCAPGCCCAVGMMTVVPLSENVVTFRGLVSGGPACYYQDVLEGNLTVISPSVATLSLLNDTVLTANLTSEGSIIMTPAYSPQCQETLERRSDSKLVTEEEVDQWLGEWEIEAGTCTPSSFCCCAMGNMTVFSPVLSMNLSNPVFMIQGHTDNSPACGNVSDLAASFTFVNGSTARASTRATGITSIGRLLENGTKLSFASPYFDCGIHAVRASAMQSQSGAAASSQEQDPQAQPQPSGQTQQGSQQTPASTAATTPAAGTQQGSADIRKRWSGKYKTAGDCQPGPRCCCATGDIVVSSNKSSTDPTAIVVSSSVDGGNACFRMSELKGQCFVSETDPNTATCQSPPAAGGVSVDFELQLSEDGSRLDVLNSFYPDCPNHGTKAPIKARTSSAAAHGGSAFAVSVLVASTSLLLGLAATGQ